jgi:hypothetical protein
VSWRAALRSQGGLKLSTQSQLQVSSKKQANNPHPLRCLQASQVMPDTSRTLAHTTTSKFTHPPHRTNTCHTGHAVRLASAPHAPNPAHLPAAGVLACCLALPWRSQTQFLQLDSSGNKPTLIPCGGCKLILRTCLPPVSWRAALHSHGGLEHNFNSRFPQETSQPSSPAVAAS